MPKMPLSPLLRRYGSAILALALATLLRMLLDPILGDRAPFPTYFGAVVFVAWYAGLGPALITLVGSALLAGYLFVSPRGVLPRPEDTAYWISLGLHVFAALFAIVLAESLRASKTRAEASEKRFRRMLETASVGVLIGDQTGQIHYANPALRTMLGYTAEEIQAGRVRWDRITPPEYAEVDARAAREFQKNGMWAPCEKEYLAKDGRRIPVLISGALLKDATAGRSLATVFVSDLTALKQTQEALRVGEERLRLAAEVAAFGTYDFNPKTGESFWSPELKTIAGLAEDVAIGMDTDQVPKFVHPADHERIQHAIRASLDPCGPGVYEEECRIVRPDGNERWVVAKGKTFFSSKDGDRQPVRALGTILDVTERKLLEQTLQEQLRFLQTVLDAIPAPIFYKNAAGVYLGCNEAFQTYLGLTKEQIVGKTVYDVAPQHLADTYREADQELLERGGVQIYETAVVYADGTAHDVIFHKAAFPCADGGTGGLVGTILDITARKHAEELLRRYADQQATIARFGQEALVSSDLPALMDQAVRLVAQTLDVEYCKLLELLPDGQALLLRAGVGWREGLIGHVTVSAGRESQAGYTLLSDSPVIVEDLATETRFSSPPLLHDHGVVSGLSVVIRGRGRPYGVMGAHTARRRTFTGDEINFLRAIANIVATALVRHAAEATLRQQAVQLAEADRRKDEFLAMLAHELRNPLAPISNALQLIKRSAGRPAVIDDALRIGERQMDQLVRLVDDLLDVARITRGKITLHKARVTLQAVVQSALETARPLIEAAGHRLAVKLPEAPVYLEADLTRLAQAVSNLLINAAKYTAAGGQICLAAHCAGDEVIVTVQDTGIGIPATQLSRVFDLFAQFEPPLGGTRGLGVGLALVKSLVELHGGRITAASAGPGQGSTFTLYLPLPVSPATADAAGGSEAPAPFRPRRVLVVDDDADVADSMALLLEACGHAVRIAYDGASALETARAWRPEVVLLDLGMPGLNGLEVARRLRAVPELQGTVLVALTGWGQEADRQRSRAAGFDHHLVKPIDIGTLESLLRRDVKEAKTEPKQPDKIR